MKWVLIILGLIIIGVLAYGFYTVEKTQPIVISNPPVAPGGGTTNDPNLQTGCQSATFANPGRTTTGRTSAGRGGNLPICCDKVVFPIADSMKTSEAAMLQGLEKLEDLKKRCALDAVQAARIPGGARDSNLEVLWAQHLAGITPMISRPTCHSYLRAALGAEFSDPGRLKKAEEVVCGWHRPRITDWCLNTDAGFFDLRTYPGY